MGFRWINSISSDKVFRLVEDDEKCFSIKKMPSVIVIFFLNLENWFSHLYIIILSCLTITTLNTFGGGGGGKCQYRCLCILSLLKKNDDGGGGLFLVVHISRTIKTRAKCRYFNILIANSLNSIFFSCIS